MSWIRAPISRGADTAGPHHDYGTTSKETVR